MHLDPDQTFSATFLSANAEVKKFEQRASQWHLQLSKLIKIVRDARYEHDRSWLTCTSLRGKFRPKPKKHES